MIKQIKLEIQNIHLRTYSKTIVVLGVILLIFPYLVANLAKITHEIELMNYENIFRFFYGMSILIFGTLSAVMYNKIVIKEYTGQSLTLLTTYPKSYIRVFISKVFIIFSFVFISMLLSIGISITVFLITEGVLPIVSDTISMTLLVQIFKMTFISIWFVSIIGIVSMVIGFIQKSIIITLISTIILSAIYANITISTANIQLFILGISLLGVIVILTVLSYKINTGR